ncbi:phosphate ABC transporter substrate-binding/OmpA family protein [Rheinheimera sp.]|uniref:phosphate ABC transporter substrate-binding/OmpA family protein n=1 Tax=Rheinheimera sp. TaxID=1869214 RepID=UPI0027B9D7D5|nr:phosphate ABC transporter substrate-binding/OmpA family protein [Rheinheimera sp.]
MNTKSTNATSLNAAIARLVQHCQVQFQIQLSESQLQQNVEYRNSVLAELAELEDAQLQQLITEIIQLSLAPEPLVTAARDGAHAQVKQSAQPQEKKALFKWWPVATALLSFAAVGLWFVFPQFAAPGLPNTPPLAAMASTQAPAEPHSSNASQPTEQQTALRLHGSNTVGEKLAPALLQAFLTQQGGSAFSWQKQNNEVERLLTYQLGGQKKLAQLHAHGSSTAFKDLLSGKADIGMSSRRVTSDEVTKSLQQLGDLSKIGNEHIIALDGLAVIVNQNNTLKSISTEVLAKVFAGEIKSWKELGGADKPIVILARDDNSGTFDTFNSLVLKKFEKSLTSKARRFESSTELSVAVSQDETAIGFIGLDFISYNKALAISEGANTTPIYPTRFTISTEDYALSRRLYLYTPTSASQSAKDFAQFAISDQGQALVEQAGLISQNIKVEKVFAIENAPASYNRYADSGQRLSLNFRFNQGENDLDNKGKRDLERLIRFMEQHNGRRLVLMGFSDAVGAEDTNTDLAMRRAKVIERELVARGIAVMAVESYGELLPIANNDQELGRERNRRVEVWVI